MNDFTRTIINGLKTYIQKSRGNWNQNDETAVDYIKNRTHWSEEDIIEILPETAIEMTEENDLWLYDILPKMLVEGTVYTVTWNGIEYTCLARNDSYNDVYIGNQAIGGGRFPEVIESSEPFFIVTYAPENFSGITAANIGTYTIKISYQDEVIHKIDKKYLPENIKNILDGSAEGSVRTVGSNFNIGKWAFAEGNNTTASGYASHAEGQGTKASNDYSHAEGGWTTASGDSAHAEGRYTRAYGDSSHTEGFETIASGYTSHAEGYHTKVSGDFSHVQGKYNVEDVSNRYAHIVGNGNYNALSNAHTLDWDGNAWFAGDIRVGGIGQDDNNSVSVITEKNINSPRDYFALTDIDNGYTYIIQMKNGNLVSRHKTSSIEVTTMPNKIEYYAGEYLDPTGMIVTATCEDGAAIEITNYRCSDNQFVIGRNTVTISYDEAGNTYTTTIIVNAVEFDAATILIDFDYTDNSDGTYTITSWKGTKNGVASTEMVVPNNSNIIL